METNIGIITTALESRKDNVKKLLRKLRRIYYHGNLSAVVVVCDGWDYPTEFACGDYLEIYTLHIDKHKPGQTQPRNMGVYCLSEMLKYEFDETNYIWFLDSDVIPNLETLEVYIEAINDHPEVDVFIGQYNPEPPPDLRKNFFEQNDMIPKQGDLSYALACWGGNLIWKRESFAEVGGFHSDLYAGRCEDGELGLRAASMGKTMMPVKGALAEHITHPVNVEDKIRKNERDVPLINSWHPWVEEQGLVLSDKDGARFDRICPQCDLAVNSLEWWKHDEECMQTHKTEQA